MSTTPLLKDLCEYITPHYAADWEIIGTLLGLPSRELKAMHVEAGFPTSVKWCCNQLFKRWIEMDNGASCINCSVIESLAVSCSTPDKSK